MCRVNWKPGKASWSVDYVDRRSGWRLLWWRYIYAAIYAAAAAAGLMPNKMNGSTYTYMVVVLLWWRKIFNNMRQWKYKRTEHICMNEQINTQEDQVGLSFLSRRDIDINDIFYLRRNSNGLVNGKQNSRRTDSRRSLICICISVQASLRASAVPAVPCCTCMYVNVNVIL